MDSGNSAPPLTIPMRFRGPAYSGNGGWVSGAIAQYLDGAAAVTVRLRQPPPLDRPLDVIRADDGSVQVTKGGTLVATAEASPPFDADLPAELPLDIGYAAAVSAGEYYRGLEGHPFPTCFSCGTGRDPAEALCLRTGPFPGSDTFFATAWTPAEVTPEITWAALDCPGAWAGDVAGRPMVLGTMTGQLDRLPRVGEPHVVLSWISGEQGRKLFSHCVLVDAGGQVLARTASTWIIIDPDEVNRPR